MKTRIAKHGLYLGVGLCTAVAAQADIAFDDDVTPDVIFGSGNANGSFTVDRADGVELGLRGKLRHNAVGDPENTFNSNGDGTYSFSPGVGPGQPSPFAPEWSFEWSVNSDYDDSSGLVLKDLDYELALDSDPTLGTAFLTFDPINQPYADHAIGDNSTGNGGGAVAPYLDAVAYEGLICSNNVAQNSWKPHWFIPFDPTVEGTYDIVLSAFDPLSGLPVASTAIQVIVGAPDDDGDGLPNAEDQCPLSDLSPTVVIGGCDSGVDNVFFPETGCTISDLVQACAVGAKNHGQFVRCVAKLTNRLKKAGVISGKEKGRIQRCAGKAK